MIAEFDRARREPRGVDLARGGNVVDAKFLRLRDGIAPRRSKQCTTHQGENHDRHAPH